MDKVYQVRRFGEKFGVILGDDPEARPVGEKLCDDANNAHRRKRKLNKAIKDVDAMIARDGAIII